MTNRLIDIPDDPPGPRAAVLPPQENEPMIHRTTQSTRSTPHRLTTALRARLVRYLVSRGRHGSMLSADVEDLLIAAATDEDDTVVGSHDHDGLICVSHGPWKGWYQGTPPSYPPVNTMQARTTNGIQ